MERLTIPDEPIEGGMRRSVVDARAVKEHAMTIYWKLKEYEDTGLEPERVLEINDFEKSQCVKLLQKMGSFTKCADCMYCKPDDEPYGALRWC